MLWAMATSNTATDSAVPLEAGAVEALASSFRGALIRPGDRTYDEHRRVWNGSIDRYPALIARCAGVEDIIAAVRFARIHGLLVAVRGGGHSYPGYSVCDGGMVIDLSLMKRIHVDPETRTVRVQAGVLLGELDRETQAFGFAVPAGFVSHTGVAGLTPIFTQRIDPNFRRSRSGGGGRPTRERRPGGGRLGAAPVSRYAG